MTRSDVDAEIAQIMARAAALPKLNRADYAYPEQLIDAEIALVVKHSRISAERLFAMFHDPDEENLDA